MSALDRWLCKWFDWMQELKKMIQAEGEAVPGKEVWDPVECVMTKAECPKEVGHELARHRDAGSDYRWELV